MKLLLGGIATYDQQRVVDRVREQPTSFRASVSCPLQQVFRLRHVYPFEAHRWFVHSANN